MKIKTKYLTILSYHENFEIFPPILLFLFFSEKSQEFTAVKTLIMKLKQPINFAKQKIQKYSLNIINPGQETVVVELKHKKYFCDADTFRVLFSQVRYKWQSYTKITVNPSLYYPNTTLSQPVYIWLTCCRNKIGNYSECCYFPKNTCTLLILLIFLEVDLAWFLFFFHYSWITNLKNEFLNEKNKIHSRTTI